MFESRLPLVAVLLAVACTLSIPANGMSTVDGTPPGSGPAIATEIDKAGNDLGALESKLLGKWRGDGPCVGNLVFLPNGKYERNMRGPGGESSSGTWALRWKALPPTLVLTCKSSDDAEEEGKTDEVKVVELDDTTLAIKHWDKTTTRYSRTKK